MTRNPFDDLSPEEQEIARRLVARIVDMMARGLFPAPPAIVTARLLGVRCCEVQEN